MRNLEDKNVLITGAATGIGRLMALHFAEGKSNLAIVDVNKKGLNAIEKEIKKFGVKV